MKSSFDFLSQRQSLTVKEPQEPITYDNFQQRLMVHLDKDKLKQIGVLPQDYSTHSFRFGGLSVINADKVVNPAFIKRNTRPNRIDNTLH